MKIITKTQQPAIETEIEIELPCYRRAVSVPRYIFKLVSEDKYGLRVILATDTLQNTRLSASYLFGPDYTDATEEEFKDSVMAIRDRVNELANEILNQ